MINRDRFQQLQYPLGILLLCSGMIFPLQGVAVEETSFSSIIAQTQENSRICPRDLDQEIDKIIKDEKFKRSQWGIFVQTLESGETLYALDAQKYFLPASNVKLLTTAAALLKFGSQFQIRTPVYGTGIPPYLSTLTIVGQGDPSLTTEQLESLAKSLKTQGVRRIDQLRVADSYAKKAPINPTWEWEDIQFYYGTAVNRLILNENAVILKLIPQAINQPLKLEWSDLIAAQQWQVNNQTITRKKDSPDSLEIQRSFAQPLLEIRGELAIDSQPDIFGLAVVDPGIYFLETLKKVLLKEGIIVTQAKVITTAESHQGDQELATINSPPLAMLIKKANEESNNLYAESLLNLLGNQSLEQISLTVLEETLTQLGVQSDLYHLKDGSGLSRHNLVSPEALVTTLRLMDQTAESEAYHTSLAVGGVRGTLEKRFKATPLEGKVQAKTGTLSGVSALSGYLDPPNYQSLVFSIIVNQSELSSSELRVEIDRIALILGRINQC